MTNIDQFMELFRKINKFDLENAQTFEIHSPGHITYKMTVQEKHLSSPNTAHGACIAALMDCVLGLSSLSEALTKDQLVSTVEFKINFIRPVKLGETMVGNGNVVHKGKSLIISSGEIRNEAGDLIALGQGTFNAYPMSKKDFLHEFTSAG